MAEPGPITRFVAVCNGLLFVALGGSQTRRADEGMLVKAVGSRWLRVAKSLPVVVLIVWLLVWTWAKFFGSDEGVEDPFGWWRALFQGSTDISK
jgi:hypothetical protein